ncbi:MULTISPECIES: fumarylacetoacetate hydrolase family protein [unclassified Streptomyces]|uniref:fumarylacetoacetate hydrolase family protein n=1 Tax=unclassified Streptomyces TaxID=2593676 RepID=UPI002DDC179C|nr:MULTISPECIES: fumarylacetoacetate hydrolase family protein [unclassified Streptomyces]WSA94515.1 fumarylacetoacetate hydrolase family protein [Streptomyces sp. NBC_01795]WSB78934.1 fumarylacetoacetate hydrolase family protein [Streptomyces sp. NBC_01775]WSS12864.1 fumarylacetoacetate hydrolase family protein [Streptomyces sp. NBC_01186]WSS41648.1 fumarylacetoacetate hydrolase family protein [Streptomyces sp. NBC_01187]
MKLLRVGSVGAERPALLDETGTLRDLSGLVGDIDGALLADGAALGRVREAAAAGTLPELASSRAGAEDTGAESLRIGPPLANIGKIVCIGLNYHDHARETGAPVPEEPILFMKAPDTVVGPHDTVLIPRGSVKTDWEVELAVVIGRTARYLDSHEEALAAVAGYAVANDVSERAFQIERGGQWDKGKNCETFNPLGPWLVTADEVPDPQALTMRLWVNGELRQDGSSGDQIFPVAEVVRYLSQFMTLYPGDVISTGTPAGVAMGMAEPKPYLREGDMVELEIAGLGRQRQVMKSA